MPHTVYRLVKEVGLSDGIIRRLVRDLLLTVKHPEAVIRLHFVGDRRMKHLNAAYRGKDAPTDVLSFPLQETGEKQPFPNDDWGDVFLSPAYIRRQAQRFEIPYREECIRMMVHGVLHLFGHDHEAPGDAKRMFALQERIVRRHL